MEQENNMTNGEKIKEIFPEAQIEYGESDVYIWLNHEPVNFSREAWESNYSEIPNNSTTDVPANNVGELEPTTRNCLGCKYSKDNHNAGTEECHLCMWENQYTPTTKNDLSVSSGLEKTRKNSKRILASWIVYQGQMLSE